MFKYVWIIILVMLNIGVVIDAIKAKKEYQNDFDFEALEDASKVIIIVECAILFTTSFVAFFINCIVK